MPSIGRPENAAAATCQWRHLQPALVTGNDPLSPAAARKLVWLFIALGLAARAIRYLLCFPLWEDECFLVVNYIDASYADLAGPLRPHQVAPLLFLWIELSVVRLLGFTEMSLRLFPFVCSIAGLLLFRHLAGRLLQGTALVAAVAVFSVAYPGIRYAAEAKQYGSDLLSALVLLAMLVEYWRSRKMAWLWGLAAVGPLLIWLSYTAAFVAGGVSLVLLAMHWRDSTRARWVSWALYNALLAMSFAGLFVVSASAQASDSIDFMQLCWEDNFPPLANLLDMPRWLLVTHTGDLLAVPFGGRNGASTLTFMLCALGALLLVRSRRWPWLAVCFAPAVVHMAAAAMKRYPYGGAVKFSMHLVPAISLLAGLGVAACIVWYTRRRPAARWPLAAWFSMFALVALGSIARDLTHPYKTLSDQHARSFAQWFWFHADFDGEVVCLKSDLQLDFSPETYTELGWASMYLANRAIYAPASVLEQSQDVHRAAEQPLPADRPLRCLVYRDPRFAFDEAALQEWLAQMQQHFELVGRDTFPFPRYNKRERQCVHVDTLEVFKFVPRAGAHASLADVPGAATLRR